MGKRTVVFHFALMIVLGYSLSACTRGARDHVQVSFPAPEQGAMGLPSLGADRKFCFAVNVVASDLITTPQSSCSPALGVVSDFVDSGQDIIVSVKPGTARKVELYAYLVPSSQACPSWDAKIATQGSHYGRMYQVGSVDQIDIAGAEIRVDLPIVAVPLNRSVLTTKQLQACESPQGPRLIAQLTSAGELRNPNLTPRQTNFFTRVWETVFQWDPNTTSDVALAGVTSAGRLVSGLGQMQVPAHVWSVVRKPDSLDYYGLIGDGKIVRLDPSSGVLSEPSPETCPFAFDGCRVPPWTQSISAGYGDRLYILDHGGGLYVQQANWVPQKLPVSIPAHVSHVVYY